MSAPRAKRPFAGAAADPSQRQITTFFTSTRPGGPQQKHAQRPALPSTVESGLLNVGMRVREAVPQGYKTGSPTGAFHLWDEHAPVRARRGAAGAGELAPFCGVNKVGGYAVQPALPDEDEDEVPGLTSSQETVGSVEFENSRKRGFEEEEGEVLGGGVMIGSEGNRVIAVPRRRRKGRGQENAAVNDFEEADFLDERVFGEVAMSDA